MAAEVAAGAGHDVVVFDQHRSPARKFVLAGRGGLNLTHSEPIDVFLDRYGPERPHLESAIRAFSPDDLRAWCAGLGHETFVGTSGRVFPNEFRAVPLLRSWLRRLEGLAVRFEPQHRWIGWGDDEALQFATPSQPVSVRVDRTILALGGPSWPRVGGDGSWRTLLTDRGVRVEAFQPANCGVDVEWSGVMSDRFSGVPIKNAAVIVEDQEVRGDPVVTRAGLEGGPIYAQSRRIREALTKGSVSVQIDLMPDLDIRALTARLTDRRRSGDTATKWLRRAGIPAVGASLMREATANQLPKDPFELAQLAKAVPITVTSMSAIDRAISSAGGVAWTEIGPGFELESLPGVHVVGEMLDWEAPTGGYLLQACFSTAHAVGRAAVASELSRTGD